MCSNPAPKWEGKTECKPSPSLPAQVQPLGRWDVLSCPGNVFPGHAASISLSWFCWDHPPICCLSLLWRDTLCWGWGNCRRTRTCFFGGAQLPAAAVVVNSEYGWATWVKALQPNWSETAPRAGVDPIPSCTIQTLPGAKCEAWVTLDCCCTHGLLPRGNSPLMPNHRTSEGFGLEEV